MKTKKIFIKQHLGMGDNISHNGMVRKISEENKDAIIYVPAKSHNFDNVIYMYRDNKNIKILNVYDDNDMTTKINMGNYDEIVSPYLINDTNFDYGKTFDDTFYYKINMDPLVRKKFFYIERDLEKEKEVFDELVGDISEYIFLHEKDDVKILRNKINTDLPIIYADKKYKIFDLLKVIERAKECHFISSSFLSLMMCKKYNDKVYAHMYSDRIELSEYVKKNGIEIIL